ncbi:MAG: 2,3-bisphosphoglycerate-independent phosphoglycerate mutase [Elusimicrobia bacterium]|nr:2,3-bisphosphoglycerate-independent phosphoglycerate mutase [Elusimicrobiota bacterium]
MEDNTGKIYKAVLLAAGLGSRLKPLTDEVPKCLTEVHGKPIINQTLEILEKNGIRETVIVIGYLGEIVEKKVGTKYRNMSISYIRNDIYDETNSMYSAWLARKYLEEGAILIEGDTFFEEKLFSSVMERKAEKSFWVLDRFRIDYDGSLSVSDEKGRIIETKIVRGQLAEYKDNYFKSTGVLKLTGEYGREFSRWLDEEVKKGNTNIYYDLVIAEHLKDAPLYVHDITGLKWAELDSFDDLVRVEKIFTSRKHVVIIIDGAADMPQEKLGNRTPLEAADIPSIDKLAREGKTGLMRTMYPGLPVGSIVANMGMLGYNPLRYYPNGRASFEALAQDIFMDEGDIAFRCNLVSVSDGILRDFTAKNIDYDKGKKIIEGLDIPGEDIEIYPGQGYRNLFILRNAGINAGEISSSEPHMNIGKPVRELLLKGKTPSAEKISGKLNEYIMKSAEKIKAMNRSMGTKADMIFLWSPSSEPRLPSFRGRYGVDGAVIAGLDFMRGIAIAARMEAKKIHGATGHSDTNIAEKLRHTINALKYNDFIYLHLNAPDEESHSGNLEGKIRIIEKIDREVVKPLKKYLDDNYAGKYRMTILPDHYTLLENGEHSDKLVPYLVYGEGIKKDDVKSFSERAVEERGRTMMKNYEFIDFLLKG